MSRVGAKYRPRRAKNTCVCQWCKNTFQATRYDAKTCSKRCRKALSRHTSEGHFTEIRKERTLVINSAGKKSEQLTFIDSDRVWVSVS